MLSQLDALDNPVKDWVHNIPRSGWAVSGYDVASLKSVIDAQIARHTVHSDAERNVFLVNIGVNDDDYDINKAQWMSNYQYIIDAIKTKWSDAEIFLATPWHRNHSWALDSIAVWIGTIIDNNPGSCFAGHDERIWLEGGDDGATMTYDGWHYTDAGEAECANQWKTILGH